MKVINCTPHAVNVVGRDGVTPVATFEASGILPRCKAETVTVEQIELDGIVIDITETQMGAVENLPAREEGTLLIVSMLVAKACPDRDDLVIPNEAVRDAEGRIVGCMSLGRV